MRREAEIPDAHGFTIRRVRCYEMPSLGEAREKFEKAVKQQVTWPPMDDSPVDSEREFGGNDEVEL